MCDYKVCYIIPNAECSLVFFFFNDPATTEIYTLSLHDALPIWPQAPSRGFNRQAVRRAPHHAASPVKIGIDYTIGVYQGSGRSEEHTSELQSRQYLVCRLLLEKKKKQQTHHELLYFNL